MTIEKKKSNWLKIALIVIFFPIAALYFIVKQIQNPETRRNGFIFLAIYVVLMPFIVCPAFAPNEAAIPAPAAVEAVDADAIYTQAAKTLVAEYTANAPTQIPEPTNPPLPTNTPIPTNTPVPIPTQNPNLITQGTYIVGTNIQPGLYLGQAGQDILDSCYWERLSDLSGGFEAILANENSVGKYYIEVRDGDFALKTDCDLYYLPGLPAHFSSDHPLPQNITAGTYLVGIDIHPGTYQGQAGTDILESCYWARLSNVAGSMDGIITNDNANGQYYAQVLPTDFAFKTGCDLVRIGD